MGQRLRGLTLLVVLLGVGILLGSSLAQWWEIGLPLPGGASSNQIQGRVRVEVLNGGGRPGVARYATVVLRDMGLDVVYYGNAENFSEDPSVVMDRGGRPDAAQVVAEALGIRIVKAEPDSTLYVDVTVRLGPEWAPEPDPAAEQAETPAWWDLRRFFRKKASS
jgi:hypothetical protein